MYMVLLTAPSEKLGLQLNLKQSFLSHSNKNKNTKQHFLQKASTLFISNIGSHPAMTCDDSCDEIIYDRNAISHRVLFDIFDIQCM